MVGARRVWGMALIRFVLLVGFGTLTGPWWDGGGWAHAFRASLLPAGAITAFLVVAEWYDRRRADRQGS